MNKIFGYAITRNGEQLAVAIAKDGKTIALVPQLLSKQHSRSE